MQVIENYLVYCEVICEVNITYNVSITYRIIINLEKI